MTITEIKTQLSMSAVLAYYGLSINKNKHLNCPFHDDKRPSMKVFMESGVVRCFSGNCQQSDRNLDVIEFVMLKESCNKHEAIMKCKSLLGHRSLTQLGDWKATTVESPQKTIWRILRKRMGQTEKAKSYLKARGLNHQGVGYNSGNWKGNYAQAAALCGVDAWGKNCVVYPLKNALGQVVSFYAHSLTFGHFYQSGRAGLYPCYPSKTTKKIILTESIIDAHTLLSLEALKDYEILALFGTNGLTKEHEKALQNCKELEEVYLMLDGDEAGRKASIIATANKVSFFL